jgi:hypothetical protein
MFSGGIGSWAAAKRVAERHGTENLTLLFTDTLIEDADLYRFLNVAARNVFQNSPMDFVRIAEGRTPWQVFRDNKMIGNTQADICSRILKRELGDRWLADNCDPTTTTVYLGIDWSEINRFDSGAGAGAKHRYARLGWCCEAPLCERPWLDKREMLALARANALHPSRAYEQGFAHDNCGGFCIKAGQGHYANLYRVRPDVYRLHEAEEADPIFGGHTIMRDRTGGETKPLSLRQLRERIEAGGQVDMFDIGGCGCFL